MDPDPLVQVGVVEEEEPFEINEIFRRPSLNSLLLRLPRQFLHYLHLNFLPLYIYIHTS
jgi:hypothetical protein